MNPEQNQTESLSGMEYLDQISIKPPSKFSFINKKILIGAVAFVVLLVILLVANVATSNRSSGVAETLSAQLSSLSTLISYGENNDINNTAVKQAVAEASLVIASSKSQLSGVTTLPNASKEAIARENVAGTTATLDSARSTGNLSSKYATAVRDKIDEVLLSLEKLLEGTSSTANRQVVVDVISNFTEMRNRFNSV